MNQSGEMGTLALKPPQPVPTHAKNKRLRAVTPLVLVRFTCMQL